MTNFLLEMKGISKSFPGVKALDGVTFNVRPGTVHALMGENGAGKSTLMKSLFGIYKPDAGEIVLNGTPVTLASPKAALDLGIAMIHQELHPVRDRSVMENVWLGRFPKEGLGPFQFVSHRKMREQTLALFKELGITVSPDGLIGKLSVSEIQSIEIAKAVSYRSKIIIMDEPTSSLTGAESDRLFAVIKELTNRGVAVIYISHKMEEILRIADDVSIMRDGKMMGTWPAPDLTIDLIISRMVGRDLTQRFPTKDRPVGEVFMQVKDVSSRMARSVQSVSFDLKKGEILGIGGLMGAQRTELIETLFGLRGMASGQIFINGVEVKIRTPQDAIRNKMALLTEDRRATGIFPSLSVLENIVVANQKAYVGPFGLLKESPRVADSERGVKDLRVKTPNLSTPIRNLSGGNQQKVLLARWLLIQPDVLLLDEPSRGIDVGAKAEIYALIDALARQGRSVIVISSEMPELMGISDRILVMCEGRLAGIVPAEGATEEKILRLATQFVS